jgi:hypothetical protein
VGGRRALYKGEKNREVEEFSDVGGRGAHSPKNDFKYNFRKNK